MSKLVRLQRRQQSSDGVNWYPLDTYRVAYVIEEESNCQDDDIVYTKWVNTSEFECENGTKHFLAKKQLSYDNQSWFDANPIEYRRNGITVSGAWECQGIEPTAPYSRLVETDLWECGDNYTKHYLSERQFSYDNIEWFSYIPKKYEWDATRTEYYSKDCGYMPPKEQSVHLYFTDGTEDWVFHPSSYIEPHYYDGINGIYGRNDIEKVEIGQMLIRIDEYAFANQPNLKEAYFEDYVIDSANNIFFGDQMLCKVNDNPRGTLRLSTEVLGNGAFNYTAFDTIILDEGNKSIGVSTFASMGNLTSVTLPSTVETISGSAFYNCFSLDNIDIAATTPPQIEFDTFLMVKEYGKLGFPNGSDYSQWLSFDEFYLGYYHWRERIGDYDVRLTFQDGTRRVDTYSDGIIPHSAYTSGSTIVKVEIGDRIRYIGESAFGYCENLEDVEFGNGLEGLLPWAFYRCSNIKSLTFPNSLKAISMDVFAECTSLTSVTFNEGLDVIAIGAFRWCLNITSITIPNSITSIQDNVFYYCLNLSSVTYNGEIYEYRQDLEEALTANGVTLGTDVFKKTALKERFGGYDVRLTFQDGTTQVDTYSDGIIPSYAYTNGTTIVKVEIGDRITEIGYQAFRSCSGLTSVDIGDSVTSIGSFAFNGCTKLTSIIIPDSVTSISSYTFQNCSGLTSVTIGDSVETIDDSAFSGCTSLTSVTIPDSVTRIDDRAFANCSGLTSITIGDSVTSIGQGAFRYCYSLTSVTIPDSVTSLGIGAFNVCSGLTSVEIGSGVTSIGSSAFYLCKALTSVTIPDSVTSIGSNAFYSCKISSITIPDSVTSIGTNAFEFCSRLSSVTYNDVTYEYRQDIEEALTANGVTLGTDVFKKTALKERVVPPTPLGEFDVKLTFQDGTTRTDTYSDGRIPNRVYYEQTNIVGVEIGNRITTIGNYAFEWCENINSVQIGNGVTSISEGAFFACESLTSITIPDSVTYIGDIAFSDCLSLTSITIPSGVTSIGYGVFSNCTNLTSVTIHDSVTNIDNEAFLGCSGLTSVTIPDSVTSIGNNAFESCASLSSVTYNDVTYEYREDLEEALTANGVTLGTDVFKDTALKER